MSTLSDMTAFLANSSGTNFADVAETFLRSSMDSRDPPERVPRPESPSAYFDVQFLMTAVDDSLPAVSAVRRCCEENVSVEDTGDGYLITWTTDRLCFYYCHPPGFIRGLPGEEGPDGETYFKVGGCRVRVDPLVPDLYGCEVKVTKGQVEVNVGLDVVDAIRHSKENRDEFMRCLGRAVWISAPICCITTNSGQMIITNLSHTLSWPWEILTLHCVVTLLKQFRTRRPQTPLSAQERCLGKWINKSTQELSFSASVECHATMKCYTEKEELACKISYNTISAKYPGLQIFYSLNNKTITLKGELSIVEEMIGHFKDCVANLKTRSIPLKKFQAMMMKSSEAQEYFHHMLNSENIVCTWTIELSETQDTVFDKLWSNSEQMHGNIIVTASKSHINTIQHTLQSCFPTTEVHLGKIKSSYFQSDSWKQYLDTLQKLRRKKVAPVFHVEENKVIVCDTASDIHVTRRDLLHYIHHTVIEPHQECFEQEVEKTITTLQAWQIVLLRKLQDQSLLPNCFQTSLSMNSAKMSVHLKGPFDKIDQHVSAFMIYMLEVTSMLLLPAESCTQQPQMCDVRKHIQDALDKKGPMHKWYRRQHSNSLTQKLANIFLEVAEQIHATDHSCARSKDHTYQEQQTEEARAATSVKEQRTDHRYLWKKGQQTGTIATENKPVQQDIRTDFQKTETEATTKEGMAWTEAQIETEHLQQTRRKTQDVTDQPRPDNSSEEDPSLTLVKSVVSSQDGNTGGTQHGSLSSPSEVLLPPQGTSDLKLLDNRGVFPVRPSQPSAEQITLRPEILSDSSDSSDRNFRRSSKGLLMPESTEDDDRKYPELDDGSISSGSSHEQMLRKNRGLRKSYASSRPQNSRQFTEQVRQPVGVRAPQSGEGTKVAGSNYEHVQMPSVTGSTATRANDDRACVSNDIGLQLNPKLTSKVTDIKMRMRFAPTVRDPSSSNVDSHGDHDDGDGVLEVCNVSDTSSVLSTASSASTQHVLHRRQEQQQQQQQQREEEHQQKQQQQPQQQQQQQPLRRQQQWRTFAHVCQTLLVVLFLVLFLLVLPLLTATTKEQWMISSSSSAV